MTRGTKIAVAAVLLMNADITATDTMITGRKMAGSLPAMLKT